jgi:hypothetical protein
VKRRLRLADAISWGSDGNCADADGSYNYDLTSGPDSYEGMCEVILGLVVDEARSVLSGGAATVGGRGGETAAFDHGGLTAG